MYKMQRAYLSLILAMLLGIGAAFSGLPIFLKTAESISSVFMNLLKLISLPIVFLSITATLSGLKGFDEMKILGKKVFVYTLLTTIVAATVALLIFIAVDPAHTALQTTSSYTLPESGGYLSFLLQIVPPNLTRAFLENNVIAVAFVAILLGIAILKLPTENRELLHKNFQSLFKAVLKITEFVIALMPLGIFAFTFLLVKDLQQNHQHFNSLLLYLSCVLGANLLQGFVVLPILLKCKKISPWKTAKGAMEALTLAFFSKSSNATLPLTLKCAENRLAISPKVANFSLPLCTVINMNGCAAFILTTVLFVATLHGKVFTGVDLGMWVILATIAAIGNAGIPMGCFFLSSSFLIAMDMPIATMGLILPFYSFLDMIETALNVWSDISVTAIVDKELKGVYEPVPIA